jgi:hypothetical protein
MRRQLLASTPATVQQIAHLVRGSLAHCLTTT